MNTDRGREHGRRVPVLRIVLKTSAGAAGRAWLRRRGSRPRGLIPHGSKTPDTARHSGLRGVVSHSFYDHCLTACRRRY